MRGGALQVGDLARGVGDVCSGWACSRCLQCNAGSTGRSEKKKRKKERQKEKGKEKRKERSKKKKKEARNTRLAVSTRRVAEFASVSGYNVTRALKFSARTLRVLQKLQDPPASKFSRFLPECGKGKSERERERERER